MKRETFIIGDTHGNFCDFFDWQMKFSKRDFNLIHVGDIGIGFPYYKKNFLEKFNRQLKRRGIKFYGCRGNHDNPRYWNYGDGAEEIKMSNLELVPDSGVREIEGQNFFFWGGATSIDRSIRRQGWDWWQNEGPQEKILLPRTNIDVVITHGCPRSVIPVTLPSNKGEGIVQHFANAKKKDSNELLDPTLVDDLHAELDHFDKLERLILDRYDVSHWYFGHYHKAYFAFVNGINYRCLNISEIHQHEQRRN